MKRQEYKDRFTDAIKDSLDKPAPVCETCGSPLTKKQHQSMIQKLTAGPIMKEPAPFGP